MSKSSKIIWAIVLILVLVAASIVLVVYFKKRAGSDNNAEVEYALGEFTYNTEKIAIKVNDTINATLFGAQLLDNASKSVTIETTLNGEQKAGETVSVTLVATGDYGLTKEITIENIKVYGTPTLEFNTEKKHINKTDVINAALFSATGKDSFNENTTTNVSIKEVTYNAGDKVTVVLTSTDIVGNKVTKEVPDIKVYGEPVVEYYDTMMFIRENNMISNGLFGAGAKDSFGQSIETTTTIIKGDKQVGNTLQIKISATDPAGNCREEVFEVDVWGEHYYRVGADGKYAVDGEYLYFGEYPQTIKAEGVDIIGETPDDRGRYLGNDGFYYAKVESATVYSKESPCAFSNGTIVTAEETYYFKFEPIKWRIVEIDSTEENKVMLLCESIINNKFYDTAEPRNNSYKDSEIRDWLNSVHAGSFYMGAFAENEKDHIIDRVVDNSAASTGIDPNANASANTTDNIFLFSFKEVSNTEYGFNNETAFGTYYQLTADELRERKVSDYSLANGAFCVNNKSSATYRNGIWWTRSPWNDEEKASALAVQANGSTMPWIVDYKASGVVPALWINFNGT